MAITEQILTGSAVDDCLNDIASLRIVIFREFPYMYDGRREDELHYLKLYSRPESFVIIVNDGEKVVGAATGMPLRHEVAELVEPFCGTSYPVDEVYYVGKLLFSPEYRSNRGMGMQFVRMVEEQVRSFSIYRYVTCVTVSRPVDH